MFIPGFFQDKPSSILSSNSVQKRENRSISSDNSLDLDSLGKLKTLPKEIILVCFSYLNALQLLGVGTVNKVCYQLTHSSFLWKSLIFQTFPIILNPTSAAPNPNWKNLYIQHVKYEKNFILFRKRTCSIISSALPSAADKRLLRNRALTAIPEKHYFSFDEEGNLQAIFQMRNALRIYNVFGQVIHVQAKNWHAETLVHNQFIQLATLDGNYVFDPNFELQVISSLNQQQQQALDYLKKRTQEWFVKTIQNPNLDEQVKEVLKDHYKYVGNSSNIHCIRGGEATLEHKAYLIFFRAMLDNPPLQSLADASTSLDDQPIQSFLNSNSASNT